MAIQPLVPRHRHRMADSIDLHPPPGVSPLKLIHHNGRPTWARYYSGNTSLGSGECSALNTWTVYGPTITIMNVGLDYNLAVTAVANCYVTQFSEAPTLAQMALNFSVDNGANWAAGPIIETICGMDTAGSNHINRAVLTAIGGWNGQPTGPFLVRTVVQQQLGTAGTLKFINGSMNVHGEPW